MLVMTTGPAAVYIVDVRIRMTKYEIHTAAIQQDTHTPEKTHRVHTQNTIM